jgi:hypothetical protein
MRMIVTPEIVNAKKSVDDDEMNDAHDKLKRCDDGI